MNIDPYAILLLMAIAWPLLLALPPVYTRLPFAHYLILVPAVLLVLFSANTAINPPWLLFGAGFGLDSSNRWLLIMAIAIWFAAATSYNNANNNRASKSAFSFFSLTLAGHLGTLLSADIISFFCCSTLMGYGFYGLLLRKENTASIWVGRFYVSVLIIADLLLFESILLAAHGTNHIQYNFLHKAIAEGNISIAYVWLVSIAFLLKAGLWPAHIWLITSFSSATRPAYLLLSGVPVVMGLLGLVLWLPMGEMIDSEVSLYLQMAGIITVLYALIRFINKGYQSMLPALVTLLMTGFFVTGLGTTMTRPEMWKDYHYLVNPYLALLGLISAIFCFIQDSQPQTEDILLKRLIERVLRLMNTLQNLQIASVSKLSGIKTYTLFKVKKSTNKTNAAQRSGLIDAIESQIRCWPVIITLLTILLLVIIFLTSLTAHVRTYMP